MTYLLLHNNRPKNVELQVEEEEERRGNSSTSSSNHCRDASFPPPSPPTDSRSFTSDHTPEDSHSMRQYGGIPLANVDEVIDLEDPTNNDLSGSGTPVRSHNPPVFISRDSRSLSLVPSHQELEIREDPQSRSESSVLSDDVSLSRYERNTESPSIADSRYTPSSGYQSGQNVSPFSRHTHQRRHKTDHEGQPITTVGLMPVSLCTHVLLQCQGNDLTETCSTSQLRACHHIGPSNLISVHPVSPKLSKDGDDKEGAREAMFARPGELPLNVVSSFHRPSNEIRTVVPYEVSPPNPTHSDAQSSHSGSPREQHGLQGEQYNRQDTQTSNEADTSIL